MNFGVDIDGTITAMPEVFQAICSSLMARGHHVYIVTAAMHGHHNEAKNTHVGRQQQLAELGMQLGVHYTSIRLAWGSDRKGVAQAKRSICQEEHLCVLFDNDPLNVAACREVTNVLVPADNPPVYR